MIVVAVLPFVAAALCLYFACDMIWSEVRQPIMGWSYTIPFVLVELFLALVAVTIGLVWVIR